MSSTKRGADGASEGRDPIRLLITWVEANLLLSPTEAWAVRTTAGACLSDYFAAVVGDGVRRQHEVDLTAGEERLPVVGDRLLPLDRAVVEDESRCDDAAHLDVEAFGRICRGRLARCIRLDDVEDQC